MNWNLSSTNTICWYLDSGASDHMVNSKEFFTEIQELEQPIKIAVAKQKEMLYAKYSGTIHVFSNVENVFKKITFRNVLFVPDLLHNLFSVRKIEEKGMKIIFYNAKVLIQQDDNLVAMGERNDKMYQIIFNMYNMNDSANANLVIGGNANL